MTFAPTTITNLAAYWVAQGGVNLGIVGNAGHTRGYHLGKDRIYDGAGPGVGDDYYSVQLARDKAGLSNAASAIDLGRLDGTLVELRAFSRWLVTACQADRTMYRDVREIIYSPDGDRVQRYSGVDGEIHTGPGNGDSSHLTHTHISFFRDSVGRNKVPLFAPYFSTGDAVKSFPVYEARTLAKVRDMSWLYDNSALAASDGNIRLSPGRELVYVGTFSTAVRIVAYEPAAADANASSMAMFIKAEDIASTRVEPDLTQYGPADLANAENRGWNAGLAAALAAVQGVPVK